MEAAKSALSQIKDQVDKQKPDEVEEISIQDVNLKKIPDQVKSKLETFKKLIMLAFNNCDLESLENLPTLPELLRLDLSENSLSGSSLDAVSVYTKLEMLGLGGNNIQAIEELDALKKIQNLKELELVGCPISENEDYRKSVFNKFPNLEVIDREDRDGNALEDEDDEEELGDEEEDDEENDEDDDDEDDEDDDDEEYEEEDEDDEEYEEKGKKKLKK